MLTGLNIDPVLMIIKEKKALKENHLLRFCASIADAAEGDRFRKKLSRDHKTLGLERCHVNSFEKINHRGSIEHSFSQ